EVQVELTPEMVEDTTVTAAQREKEVVKGLKSMLGITVDVKVVDPKTITRSEGKAVRVVDKRNLYQN
ncbi:MAG: phenylacetate--CoA ligase, partial [Lachnospiraceae bacterium]|nr:phenylacetate--CoA ligase [Lachnospiraceae bacterium]